MFICVYLWPIPFEDFAMPDLIPPHGGVAELIDRRIADIGAVAGKRLDEDSMKEAARMSAAAADPNSDLRGPAEYKRGVLRTLTVRALAGETLGTWISA